jgi:hypothetical protein
MTAPTLTDRQRQALWDLLVAEAGRPADVPSPQVLAVLRISGLAERMSGSYYDRHAHRATDAGACAVGLPRLPPKLRMAVQEAERRAADAACRLVDRWRGMEAIVNWYVSSTRPAGWRTVPAAREAMAEIEAAADASEAAQAALAQAQRQARAAIVAVLKAAGGTP